jgi:hypothetical protein
MSQSAIRDRAKYAAGAAAFAASLFLGLPAAHAQAIFDFDTVNTAGGLAQSFALVIDGNGVDLTSFSGYYTAGSTTTMVGGTVSAGTTYSGSPLKWVPTTSTFDLDFTSGLTGLLFDAVGSTNTSSTPYVTSGLATWFVNGTTFGSGPSALTALGVPEINGSVLPRAAAVLAGVIFMFWFRRREARSAS